jgi:hypothetical protein
VPRTSAAALAVRPWRPSDAPPPAAPKYLSAGAQRYWKDIVATRPSDYFDAATRPLLEALCETYATLDDLWREINACDTQDLKGFRLYARLLVMAHRQGSMALSLVTKLRLLPARTEPMPQMARKRPGSMPWIDPE